MYTLQLTGQYELPYLIDSQHMTIMDPGTGIRPNRSQKNSFRGNFWMRTDSESIFVQAEAMRVGPQTWATGYFVSNPMEQ